MYVCILEEKKENDFGGKLLILKFMRLQNYNILMNLIYWMRVTSPLAYMYNNMLVHI